MVFGSVLIVMGPECLGIMSACLELPPYPPTWCRAVSPRVNYTRRKSNGQMPLGMGHGCGSSLAFLLCTLNGIDTSLPFIDR